MPNPGVLICPSSSCTYWTVVSLVLQLSWCFPFCTVRVQSLAVRYCVSIKTMSSVISRKFFSALRALHIKGGKWEKRKKIIRICLWFLPPLCVLEETAHLDEVLIAKAKLLAGKKKSVKFQPENIKERRKRRIEKDLKALKKALFQIYLSFRLAWCTSRGVRVL